MTEKEELEKMVVDVLDAKKGNRLIHIVKAFVPEDKTGTETDEPYYILACVATCPMDDTTWQLRDKIDELIRSEFASVGAAPTLTIWDDTDVKDKANPTV